MGGAHGEVEEKCFFTFRKPQNRCELIVAELSLSKVSYPKMSVLKTLDPSHGVIKMLAFFTYQLFLTLPYVAVMAVVLVSDQLKGGL